jgi:hypothetical protein
VIALVVICDGCGGELRTTVPRREDAVSAAIAVIHESLTTEHRCDHCEPFEAAAETVLEIKPPPALELPPPALGAVGDGSSPTNPPARRRRPVD